MGAFIGVILKQIGLVDLGLLIFTFFFMMTCAGFIYAQNWPLLAVDRIKKVLENDEYVYNAKELKEQQTEAT